MHMLPYLFQSFTLALLSPSGSVIPPSNSGTLTQLMKITNPQKVSYVTSITVVIGAHYPRWNTKTLQYPPRQGWAGMTYIMTHIIALHVMRFCYIVVLLKELWRQRLWLAERCVTSKGSTQDMSPPRAAPLTAGPDCWSEWISDSYCSLKPLWSGMGEAVPARTSPPLHPPSPPTVLWLPCLKVS